MGLNKFGDEDGFSLIDAYKNRIYLDKFVQSHYPKPVGIGQNHDWSAYLVVEFMREYSWYVENVQELN